MTKKEKLQNAVKELRENHSLEELISLLVFWKRRLEEISDRLEAVKQAVKEEMTLRDLREVEFEGNKIQIRYQKRYKISPYLKETSPPIWEAILRPDAAAFKKLVDQGQVSKDELDWLLTTGAVVLTETPALVVKGGEKSKVF